MFLTTLEYLKCPVCGVGQGSALTCTKTHMAGKDVTWGNVKCQQCQTLFPIWNGVLIWVKDLDTYTSEHRVGISKVVDLGFIEEDTEPHIDESLESDRVTALYWLGHYVTAQELIRSQPQMSSTLKTLIKKFWDRGPMQRLAKILKKKKITGSVLELGCGSGGFAHLISDQASSYLGIDTSFQGILRAREILLSRKNSHAIPGDLIQGPLRVKLTAKKNKPPQNCDFIVSEINEGGLRSHSWDLVAAFNVIDMLSEPGTLFQTQSQLLKPQGLAVQSSPYIWHPETARTLKAKPNESSPERILRLAKSNGFNRAFIDERDIPWVFFKNINQIELYNVHLLGVSRVK